MWHMRNEPNPAVALMLRRIYVLAADLRDQITDIAPVTFSGPDGAEHKLSIGKVHDLMSRMSRPVLVLDGVAFEAVDYSINLPRYSKGTRALPQGQDAISSLRAFVRLHPFATSAIAERVAQQAPPDVREISEAAKALIARRGLEDPATRKSGRQRESPRDGL